MFEIVERFVDLGEAVALRQKPFERQTALTILDRFIQIPPTITIREGHRVKVYFTQDLLLPAYSNHTIPQTY